MPTSNSKSMYFFEYVQGIVALKSNDQHFACSFGGKLAKCGEREFDACKIQASVYFHSDREVRRRIAAAKEEGKWLRFHYFGCDAENGVLFYERTVASILDLCFLMKVEDKSVSLYVGNTYNRLVRLKVSNLHPVREIMADILEALLLCNGYVALYCSSACCTSSKRVSLMFSAPHTGKTLTCMQLCGQYGFKYISEDFAVTDGSRIYGAPWTGSFRDYDKRNSTLQGDAKGKQWLRQQDVVSDVEITDLFLLENDTGNAKAKAENPQSFEEKLLSLQHYAVHYYWSPTVTVLGYADPEYRQDRLMAYERHVIHELCQKAANWHLAESDSMEFSAQIAHMLQNEKM